jgi:hypothetical protein
MCFNVSMGNAGNMGNNVEELNVSKGSERFSEEIEIVRVEILIV